MKHWTELGQLDDAERRALLSTKEGKAAQIQALSAADADEFQRAFEFFSEYPRVSDPDTFRWLERYFAMPRGTADRVAGFDMPALRWLVACVRSNIDPSTRLSVQGDFQRQLQLALACAGSGDFDELQPELERIVANYLGSIPGRFAFSEIVPVAALQQAALRLFRLRSHPIAHWERVDELAAGGSAELTVLAALNYCGQDFRRRGLETLLAAPTVASTLLEGEPAPQLSAEGQIVASLFLCATSGKSWDQLPRSVALGLTLDLCSGSSADIETTTRALRGVPQLARALLATHLKEARALALVPALGDEDLLRRLIVGVETGHIDAALVSSALEESSAAAVPVLLQAVGVESKSAAVQLAVRCAAREPSSEVVRWLSGLLAHPAAAAANAASRQLEILARDADLRPEVERALSELAPTERPKEQASRTALAERLSWSADVDARLEKVAEAAQAKAPRHDAFLALCRRLDGLEHRWPAELRPAVVELGAIALYWLRPELERSIRHGHTRLWCFAVEALVDDPDAVWVAVASFAALPKVRTAFWARPGRALAGAGSLLAEPIAYVLRHQNSEHLELLFRLLAKHARRDATEIFLLGLQHANKAVRSHSVDGLSRMRDAPIEGVLRGLARGGLGTRIAAAEILAIWARDESATVLDRALASERSGKVRPYIEDALVALSGARGVLGSRPEGAAAWAEFFEQESVPKVLPAFLRHETLPELRFRGGAPLSERAAAGFLGRVMLLDTTLKGRLLRAAADALDKPSLSSWSEFVHQRWTRAKDSRHKWAVLQLWVLADAEAIDRVGYSLSSLRPNEHVALSAYLKVLQWHRSPIGGQWLVFWSEHLPSRGVREQARELVERVAFKSGVTSGELRARADWSIGARALEHELVTADETPLLRYRLRRHLERSFRSGVGFSIDGLLDLRARFPDLIEPLVFELPDGRVKPGAALSRRLKLDSCSERLVHLAHPLRVGDAVLASFIDSPGKQPVEQLGRAVFVADGPMDLDLAALETDSERLGRWRREEGWFHGEPMDQGVVHSNFLRLPAHGVTAELLHTGYAIGTQDWLEDVNVLGLEFFDLEGQALDPDAVDDVAYSEICRSVDRLRLQEA